MIARLTLELNTEVHADLRDTVVVLGLFSSAYAAVGAAAGLAAAVLTAVLGRVAPRLRAASILAVAGLLLASPLLYSALLPDVGLTPRLLTRVLLGGSPRYSLAVLGLGALASAFVGGATLVLLGRLGRRLGRARPALLPGIWLAAAALVALPLLFGRPESPAGEASPASPGLLAEKALTEAPLPVVLLCIDGADPDDVIEPLVDRGELPTFARLRRSGVWGELETLVPALSPAIWTTLITGKTPEQHGIHHFVYFDLPGVRHPVLSFPLHTGLNFRLFPLLERLPGGPVFRRPYTSDMRREPALWTIAGGRYTVGIYRWRATWPAEEVAGFNVASGVALLERRGGGGGRAARSVYPAGLERLLTSARRPISEAEIEPYLGPARRDEIAPRLLREIERGLQDRTVGDLSVLWSRYAPRLLVAAFFSVDGFQHRFGLARGIGGPFSPAVEERYRLVDTRLGELLEILGPEVNLLVVSDHGFDFERNNHTHGPPGLFLAHGPAFRRGVEVEGLSVFDVAPLVLRLLGLPLARDMPGTDRRMDERVLAPELAEDLPRLLVPSYSVIREQSTRPARDPRIEETKQRLKDLGYID